MTQEASKFQLSAELKDHFKEVRSVAAYPVIDGAVLTSSLDNTAKLWQPKKTENGIIYEVVTTFVGHADFVIDVAYYPFHETANIVTVSHDKSIIFWSMDGTPVKTIPNAHDAQISCLCIGTDGLIATGSWDKTAKIWKDGNCIHHLKGHEMNVLAVQFLSNGTVVTGCGDGSFKIWKDGQDIATVKKHTSCVRAFCELPGIGFLSVSNDGTVRSWMLNGQEVSEFQAHNNLVYSVCILDGDQTVTSSEDKTVRIWKYGKCVQTIDHPGCVWKVVILANGDMATACADCTARVWTKKTERAANEQVVKSYNDALKNSKKTVGGVDVNSLPMPEVLNQIKGKKDGEIKLVNEQGAAIAYSWSAQSGKWEKFGEVTDGTPGVGQNYAGKEYLNGKMYDYVFDVEIQEGVTHKLGYNMGENPYTVAQQFIHDYKLSQYALDTVAKFIIQNTPQNAQQKQLPLDPFTGNNAMRSSQLMQRQAAAGSSIGAAPATNKITPQNAFSEYAKESLAKQKENEEREKQKHVKHFPRSYEQHDVANYKGIEKKIREFNASVSPAEALNESELKVLGEMVTIVTEVTLERKPFQAHHYKVLDKLLSWNKKYVFPVLDFLRVLVLLPFVAQFYSTQNVGGQENNNIIQYVLRVCFAEDSNDILLMMGLRCLANMFIQNPLRYLMIKNSMDILSTVNFKVNEPSEARVIQGYSILLHNYSIHYGSQPSQEAFVEGLLDSIKLMIQNKTHLGHDNYYLLFCAIGNLVHQDKKYLAIAQGMQLEQLAASYVFNPNPKLAGVAYQIQQVLKK